MSAALAPGAVWNDMTSNAPATARGVRERAGAHGVDVLEAPMGGSPDDAETGRLRLFVGSSAHVLDRCRPLLEAVATPDRIRRMGGPGPRSPVGRSRWRPAPPLIGPVPVSAVMTVRAGAAALGLIRAHQFVVRSTAGSSRDTNGQIITSATPDQDTSLRSPRHHHQLRTRKEGRDRKVEALISVCRCSALLLCASVRGGT
ncbi:NAD(P)-binding domain-containing protein [Streptomyces humi]